MELHPLTNLTLHAQGEREVQLAAEYGFALDAAPRGIEAGAGRQAFDTAVEQLAGLLHRSAEAGAAVLAGGHTGLWIAAVCRLLNEGAALPSIWVFEIRRVRDTQTRFVFQPEGLIEITRSGADWKAAHIGP
jgi:hypothetical protein